jgi:hypothetical protein
MLHVCRGHDKDTTMATNAFIGSPKKPTAAELSAELGEKQALWDELLEGLASIGADGDEWSSFSRKAGWSLKVLQKQRVIVYLSPLHGGLRVSFALGDRAIAVVRKTKFPVKIVKIVEEAKRYAEGTAVRVEVTSRSDITAVLKLATIKMEN